MTKPALSLLLIKQLPIFEQLQLEEALLRTSHNSFCLINESTSPAIVMGISGRPEELVDLVKMKERPLPLIRRFTGGGTVIVDEGTFFVTFLLQKEALSIPLFPPAILSWAEKFYRPLFKGYDFALRENDFVIGDRKIGGNAKYIRQSSFLLHTSFLFEFNEALMQYLLLPQKRPAYREDRSHSDFLGMLKPFFSEKSLFIQTLLNELHVHFAVERCALDAVRKALLLPHRKSAIEESPPSKGGDSSTDNDFLM